MKTSIPCPDCGERLSVDADRCGACGWTKPGARRARMDSGPRHNMTCTWHSGALFCRYPNAFFEEGRTSGFCVFHRRTPDGTAAARIAEESEFVGQAGYVERAMDHAYGAPEEHGSRPDSPSVRTLREQLAARAKGGNVGLFATRILGPAKDPT